MRRIVLAAVFSLLAQRSRAACVCAEERLEGSGTKEAFVCVRQTCMEYVAPPRVSGGGGGGGAGGGRGRSRRTFEDNSTYYDNSAEMAEIMAAQEAARKREEARIRREKTERHETDLRNNERSFHQLEAALIPLTRKLIKPAITDEELAKKYGLFKDLSDDAPTVTSYAPFADRSAKPIEPPRSDPGCAEAPPCGSGCSSRAQAVPPDPLTLARWKDCVENTRATCASRVRWCDRDLKSKTETCQDRVPPGCGDGEAAAIKRFCATEPAGSEVAYCVADTAPPGPGENGGGDDCASKPYGCVANSGATAAGTGTGAPSGRRGHGPAPAAPAAARPSQPPPAEASAPAPARLEAPPPALIAPPLDVPAPAPVAPPPPKDGKPPFERDEAFERVFRAEGNLPPDVRSALSGRRGGSAGGSGSFGASGADGLPGDSAAAPPPPLAFGVAPSAAALPCQDGARWERAKRATEALEAYRACLFDGERERAGVDRLALYQAVTRAASAARPAPALPKRASEAYLAADAAVRAQESKVGRTPDDAMVRGKLLSALAAAPWWPEAHVKAGRWSETRGRREDAVLYYQVFMTAAESDDPRVGSIARKLGALKPKAEEAKR